MEEGDEKKDGVAAAQSVREWNVLQRHAPPQRQERTDLHGIAIPPTILICASRAIKCDRGLPTKTKTNETESLSLLSLRWPSGLAPVAWAFAPLRWKNARVAWIQHIAVGSLVSLLI